MMEVSEEMFERLLQAIEKQERADADDMPTEREALAVMQRAYVRLKKLGWREGIYSPKDGTVFDAIEVGSTGIHDCHYEGEWPKGGWWTHDGGDLWPGRPTFFRLKKPASTATHSPETHHEG